MSNLAAKYAVVLNTQSSLSGKQEEAITSEGPRRNSMCFAFLKGSCSHGDLCRFFHNEYGPHHGRSKLSKKDICRDFTNGDCKFGDSCKYLHEKPNGSPAVTANRGSAKKRNSSKPKHLGRKIAAIASTLSASETHANQASSDVQCADMSSHTQTAEAMMRQLEQQQQKLQTEKEVSQQKWKALVQVKLQETLARKEALMKAELRAARKKAARISESSSTDVNAVTEAQSSIKTLQARLVRLSPSGWDQNLFDTKFNQLASKGLSRGVFLREIGVDEEGGARTIGKEDETRLRKKRRAVEEAPGSGDRER